MCSFLINKNLFIILKCLLKRNFIRNIGINILIIDQSPEYSKITKNDIITICIHLIFFEINIIKRKKHISTTFLRTFSNMLTSMNFNLKIMFEDL